MSDFDKITKMHENIKPIVNSDYWQNFQLLIKEMIEDRRDSLERVVTFDEVHRVRGYIQALREVFDLRETVENYEASTNPQLSGREFFRPSSNGTVKELE